MTIETRVINRDEASQVLPGSLDVRQIVHPSAARSPGTCQGDPSRVAIAENLQRTPGKHLIMVRYDKDSNNHNIHDEWVYNGAEIDNAKVLWARELDAEQNAKLLAYFKDRQIWLLEPDTDNTELIPLFSQGRAAGTLNAAPTLFSS